MTESLERIMRGIAGAGERINVPNEIIERVIALLLRSGWMISRPCTLEIEPIERVNAALHKAKHKQIMGLPDSTSDAIGHALLEIKNATDYLGDLRKMGVRVPISFEDWSKQKGIDK